MFDYIAPDFLTCNEEWQKKLIWRNEEKKVLEPRAKLHNMLVVLKYSDAFAGHFQKKPWPQHFIMMVVKPLPWDKESEPFEVRQLFNDDIFLMRSWFSTNCDLRVGKSKIWEALHIVVDEEMYDD